MRTSFDAVIIGAGPAGSSVAILLAGAGWSVALVEKQVFPRRKVCGECIAASNLPLLEALGIGAAFEAQAGPPLRQVALMRGGSCVVAELPPSPSADLRHRWGRALGRETLDRLLLERARAVGVQVLQPWAVRAIEAERSEHAAHGAHVTHRCNLQPVDSQASLQVRTPIVIDAHGSWEALPSARASRRPARKASDLFAFKANFRGAALQEGLLPILSFNGGYGGMVVADDGVTTLACCLRRDRLDALRRAATGLRAGEAVEAALKHECAGVRGALRTAARDGPWLAAGPIAPGIRLGADDALLRIGNAAGEAHPIIGEGMSMALQSAFLLSGHLLAVSTGPADWTLAIQREVAQRHAAAWRRAFAPRLLLASAFAHAAMRPLSGAALVTLARAWPGLLTHGARWGGKLHSAADPALVCPA